MTDLVAARSQMALSLGFHIVFAAIGVAMPFLMAIAYWRHLQAGDRESRQLTQAWSKGVAIFFAVGAVSGTLLSFELGLLWPRFMDRAGAIIGMPFSWEGAAFFLEAIAIGLFLYGWKRLSPKVHWASGLFVGLSGIASALFVVCANGWMNSPAGFDWNGGHPTNIDPWAAMFNAAAGLQGIHMVVAAFEAVGFAVAGVHAWSWLRWRQGIDRTALRIAFTVGALAAIVQPLIGDLSAKSVARRQPAKLAAMEAHFETKARASLVVGGWVDVDARQVRYGLPVPIPGLLSFLAHGDFEAPVTGLNDIARDRWPPVAIVHTAFDLMVGLGTLLALIGVLGLFGFWRKQSWVESDGFARLLVWLTPVGFLALEAGWVVTEVGRQPWIIYEILRTADAVTPRPGIAYSLALYTGMYVVLAASVAVLLARHVRVLHTSGGEV